MQESTRPYLYFENIINGITAIPKNIQGYLGNVILVRNEEQRIERERQKQLEILSPPEADTGGFKIPFSDWFTSNKVVANTSSTGNSEKSLETPPVETPSVENTPIAEITPIENTPVENTPINESIPVENTPVENTPINESIPVENTPIESTPINENTPIESTPIESTPINESIPVENTPVESTPVVNTPIENTPIESIPIESTPVENTPIENTPTDSDPVISTPIVSPSVQIVEENAAAKSRSESNMLEAVEPPSKTCKVRKW